MLATLRSTRFSELGLCLVYRDHVSHRVVVFSDSALCKQKIYKYTCFVVVIHCCTPAIPTANSAQHRGTRRSRANPVGPLGPPRPPPGRPRCLQLPTPSHTQRPHNRRVAEHGNERSSMSPQSAAHPPIRFRHWLLDCGLEGETTP